VFATIRDLDSFPSRASRIGKALADHVALEFCEDREGVEAEARDRVVRAVDAAIDDADRDVVLAEDAVDLRPVGGAPREAIESVNEDAIDEPLGDGRNEAKRPEAGRCPRPTHLRRRSDRRRRCIRGARWRR
jgi:hypothetical protein